MKLDWSSLLSHKRASHIGPSKQADVADAFEFRTPWERDYDRILFSTPVRRLADKTQVFPLERHDSVRTRLTHSHEVSNLARSIGIRLVHSMPQLSSIDGISRIVPPILGAVGLAHDLGNPPFGHKGERAIQSWFARNASIFDPSAEANASEQVQRDLERITPAMKADFFGFEGNAQTFRLLSRLQRSTDDRGLNLTFATLAAVLKYPVDSANVDRGDSSHPARKKHGYFQSEADVVARIQNETGLINGVRHPLTWLMEACDDIAYLVLDAEDAIKKTLVSPADLFAYLDAHAPNDPLTKQMTESGRGIHQESRQHNLSPSELGDVTAQRFRANAITVLVDAAARAFERGYPEIMSGAQATDLIKSSDAKAFAKALRSFDKEHAYLHRSVTALEVKGSNTITLLMDLLWEGITNRRRFDEPKSERRTPFADYAYHRISENYRRIFEGGFESGRVLPIRYREAQLLTDMVSGMTDNYMIDLTKELRQLRGA
ncbi:MAG TPA: dNTP triphosphohydrolase [Myxococcaceae bacterium]|nr:dNTP triphosphohydrolase [Myxococcaceae bacterium]